VEVQTSSGCIIGTQGDGSPGDATRGNLISGNGRGVAITAGATDNRISGNVLSGNGSFGGLSIENSSRNTVAGDFIGTNATGNAALPNTGPGMFISLATNNVISGNVISGNGSDGVQIFNAGTSGNVVEGNKIGTAADATTPLGNVRNGVWILLS